MKRILSLETRYKKLSLFKGKINGVRVISATMKNKFTGLTETNCHGLDYV